MYGYLVKLLKLEVGAQHDQDQNKLNLTFLLSYGISNIYSYFTIFYAFLPNKRNFDVMEGHEVRNGGLRTSKLP